MTCKNCSGQEICDASICCIGFEQDCGEGCDGLAVGQSRIQINAAGNLEVCSNVGGVCSCNDVSSAGTDSLVNNGGGVFIHTAVDTTATVIDICAELVNCTVENLGNVTAGAVNGQALIYDGADWNPTTLHGPPIFQCAELNANAGVDIDDTNPVDSVRVLVPALTMNFTMLQDGNITIHYVQHLRAVNNWTGQINVQTEYSIDGGPNQNFGGVHAVSAKTGAEEQHMSSNTCAGPLLAGIHTLEIYYFVTARLANVPGEIIRWNQTELLITWLEW